MWLLENKKLKSGFNINVRNIFFILRGKFNLRISYCPQSESHFESITEVLRQLSDNQVEIYWISKRFYVFSEEIASEFVKLQEMTYNLMEKGDPKLYKCEVCNFYCQRGG